MPRHHHYIVCGLGGVGYRYIESAHRTLHGYDLLNVTLTDGDVLYLTMPAHRLDCLQYISAPMTEDRRG